MNPVDPSVYRAALDRVDTGKRALRAIKKFEGHIEDMRGLATSALAAIENADKWDCFPDNRLREVSDALRELVALKDLKTAADVPFVGATEDARLAKMRAEYRRRKPIAWERARAALGIVDKPPEAAAELIAAASEDMLKDVDGYFYYFPKPNGGSLAPWMLREIANELDRRNDPWDRELDKYFRGDTP